MSRGEFGPNVGVFRILDLLETYGVPATFFIPGFIAETNEETVVEILRRGHEIGRHGYMHEPPATLEPQKEAEVLDRGLQILDRITGQRPLGYRSPSWELSPYTLDLLAERGFLYDSSLMGDDAPYFVDTANGRMVEIPVEWALDDVPYYAFSRGAGSMNTPEDVYKAWEWEFDGAYQYGRALTLTMHP
jgi:peptidoglycan/xylan/chitin deacetylase (PgdA/CDA1 family)